MDEVCRLGLDKSIHMFVNEGDIVTCLLSISPEASAKRILNTARERVGKSMSDVMARSAEQGANVD